MGLESQFLEKVLFGAYFEFNRDSKLEMSYRYESMI
jgi:hypothetical protein